MNKALMTIEAKGVQAAIDGLPRDAWKKLRYSTRRGQAAIKAWLRGYDSVQVKKE